jgi:hypothetical protein
MDRDTSFLMVESSRRQARDVRWASEVALSARLSALSDPELAAFDAIRAELHGELGQVEAGGQSLHALVYEARGGCSDDSFMDFREWVLWRTPCAGRET